MARRRAAAVAALEERQLDLLPGAATDGRGRSYGRQQELVREASGLTPLAETWNAHRQAQKRVVDGSLYGDYDGIGTQCMTSCMT